jgi:hypothetical protein
MRALLRGHRKLDELEQITIQAVAAAGAWAAVEQAAGKLRGESLID